MILTRRSLNVALLAGALAAVAAGFAPISAVAAEPSPPMDAPEAVEARRHAEERMQDRAARRATPEQRAARVHSRRQHRELSRTDARTLAARTFAPFVSAPISEPLRLPPGAQIKEYINNHWATVEFAGGDKAAAFSPLPLRVKRGGELRPVRLDLRSRADGFRSENPLVQVRFDARAGGGAELQDSGVALRPVDAADVAADIRDDRLFFADVTEDTDEILAPMATGLQVLWQLRSEDAPSAHRLKFSLPAGAELRLAERFLTDINASFGPSQDGITGAEIVRDGKVVVTIAPPATFDSDGERVPTRYSVAGDVLTVHVAHRGRDLAYPLLVDPEIADSGWNGTQLGDSPTWYSSQQLNGGSHNFSFSRDFQRDGLQVGAYQFGTYHEGATAGWNWQAPDGTYIREATFNQMRHIADSSSLITGIYRPGVWEAGPGWYGYDFDGHGWYHRAGSPTERNVAFMGLYMHGTSQRNRGAFAHLSTVNLTVGDNYPPQTTLRATPSSAWTNYRWGAIGYDMTDRGLGINAATVTRVGNDSAVAAGITNTACTGIREPCPLWHNTDAFGGYGYSQQLPYDHDVVDEGITQLHVRAQDVAGNVRYSDTDDDPATSADESQPAWSVRYDKSPPDEITLSGQLSDLEDELLDPGQYQLQIYARDGDPSPSAQPKDRRSGVVRIEVVVDEQVVDTRMQPCTSINGSCDYRAPWTFDTSNYLAGDHEIKVRAYDALGHHTISRTVTVWTQGDKRSGAGATDPPASDSPEADAGRSAGALLAKLALCPPLSTCSAPSDPLSQAIRAEGPVDSGASPLLSSGGDQKLRLRWGFADNNRAFMKSDRFQKLGISRVRLQITWDQVINELGNACAGRNPIICYRDTSTPASSMSPLAKVDRWLDRACPPGPTRASSRTCDYEPLLAIMQSTTKGVANKPSEAEYGQGVAAIRYRYPFVRLYVSWNEANRSDQASGHDPFRAGRYWRVLNSQCNSGDLPNPCNAAAGSFLGAVNLVDVDARRSYPNADGTMDPVSKTYLEKYMEGMRPDGATSTTIVPAAWAYHAYQEGNRLRNFPLKDFLTATEVGDANVWLTEQGGLLYVNGCDYKSKQNPGADRQQKATRYMIGNSRSGDAGLVKTYDTRISRFYYYSWRDTNLQDCVRDPNSTELLDSGVKRPGWDSALLAYKRGATTTPVRASYYCLRLRTNAQSGDADACGG